ncbi:MAG: hypothetical protein D6746_04755 [Bacteroidetes bacterium]|nr:MAG: hypothetical protein D6746_04755 [Bacteroidota bacterium]
MRSTLKHKCYVKGAKSNPARFASWHLYEIDHYWEKKNSSPFTAITGCRKKDLLATLAAIYKHSGTSASRNEEAMMQDAVRRYGATSINAVRHAIYHLHAIGIITRDEERQEYGYQVVGYRRADSHLTNQYIITIPQKAFRRLSFAICRAMAAVLIAYAHSKREPRSERKYVAIPYIHKVAETHFERKISYRTIYKAIQEMGAVVERDRLLVPVKCRKYVQEIRREGYAMPANSRRIQGRQYEIGPSLMKIRNGAYGVAKQPHFIRSLVRTYKGIIVTSDNPPKHTFEDTHFYLRYIDSHGHAIYHRRTSGFAPWTYFLYGRKYDEEAEYGHGDIEHVVFLPPDRFVIVESWYRGRKTFELVGKTRNDEIDRKSRYLAGALRNLGVQGTDEALRMTAMRMLRGIIYDGPFRARSCGQHAYSTKLFVNAWAVKHVGECALYSYDSHKDRFVINVAEKRKYQKLIEGEEHKDLTEKVLKALDDGYTSCATRPIDPAYDCNASITEEAQTDSCRPEPQINAQGFLNLVNVMQKATRARIENLLKEAGLEGSEEQVTAAIDAVRYGALPVDPHLDQVLVDLIDEIEVIIVDEVTREKERLQALGMFLDANIYSLL